MTIFYVNMRKKFRNYFLNYNADTLIKNNKLNISFNKVSYGSFGEKNKNKTFYVIKRSPGAGLFSNVIFVLNHLKIANKHGFIPVVDMENFPTIYNENHKIKKIKNAWEYYFNSLNKYTLNEVYKSKNVIFTSSRFYEHMTHKIDNNKFNKFKKNIKIKREHYKISNNFYNRYIKGHKVLGIHLRGSSYKTSANHPSPPTFNQVKYKINNLIKKEKFKKIFLCTEDKAYMDYMKKEFGNKILYFNTYRSYNDDAFKIYPRNNHRYNLGKEILIDTLILMKCHTFLYTHTNVSTFVKFFSKKKIRYIEFKNGLNTSNEYYAKWQWKIKSRLPNLLGGFSHKI